MRTILHFALFGAGVLATVALIARTDYAPKFGLTKVV